MTGKKRQQWCQKGRQKVKQSSKEETEQKFCDGKRWTTCKKSNSKLRKSMK